MEPHRSRSALVVESHKIFHQGTFKACSHRRGIKAILHVPHDGAATLGDKAAVAARAVILVFLTYRVVARFRPVILPPTRNRGRRRQFVIHVKISPLPIEIDDEFSIRRGDR